MIAVTKDLLEALRPFVHATITSEGNIIGLMRDDFERARAAFIRAEAAPAEPGACQQEPLTIRLDPNAPCRNALARDGKSYPKSNCQRCGTLLRPGWKCAEGVELGKPPMRGCELRDDAMGVFKP